MKKLSNTEAELKEGVAYKKSVRSIRGNFLPELIVCLLADLCWKILQQPISRISSRSFSSSHYIMTLGTNREQYKKGAKWIKNWRTVDLHCRKVIPLLKSTKNKSCLHLSSC